MADSGVARILDGLGSPQCRQAWSDFLALYSPYILQTVKVFERDDDPVADCFLFVCERLCEKGFRRLRSFDPGGSAEFTTWLRVVVRNLCLDWHRKESGRYRVFQSVAKLGALEQEVFKCVYERGLSQDESLNLLRLRHPQLTMEELEASLARVQSTLTDRQIWLASTRRHTPVPLAPDLEDPVQEGLAEIADPAPSIESFLMVDEQREALNRALGRLSEPERLLIKMRFEQGLTLQEIGRLVGLKDAQTVDRRLREVIEKLRRDLPDFVPSGGKRKDASV